MHMKMLYVRCRNLTRRSVHKAKVLASHQKNSKLCAFKYYYEECLGIIFKDS